ncbi:MAG: hypothetical protein QM489_00745 [Candidatus Izemoplasma sp.]
MKMLRINIVFGCLIETLLKKLEKRWLYLPKKRCTLEWKKRQKKKIREWNAKNGNAFQGRKHTQKSKNLMSIKAKELNAKNGNAFQGRKHTQKSKNLMSKIHKGKIISEKQREAQRKKMAKLKWWNNGIISKRLQIRPEGFEPGRLTFKRRRIQEQI